MFVNFVLACSSWKGICCCYCACVWWCHLGVWTGTFQARCAQCKCKFLMCFDLQILFVTWTLYLLVFRHSDEKGWSSNRKLSRCFVSAWSYILVSWAYWWLLLQIGPWKYLPPKFWLLIEIFIPIKEQDAKKKECLSLGKKISVNWQSTNFILWD